jgi:hypothetical protein
LMSQQKALMALKRVEPPQLPVYNRVPDLTPCTLQEI